MSRTSHEALRDAAFRIDLKLATDDELYDVLNRALEGEAEDTRFATALRAWRKLGDDVLAEISKRDSE